MEHKYDLLIIGQPSLDVNTDHTGQTVRELGGAVTFSAYSAASLGHSVAVLPRAQQGDIPAGFFSQNPLITELPINSNHSTSIQNIYHTADKERRICSVLSRIDSYTAADIPPVDAAIYHIAGLMRNDIEEAVIELAAQRSLAAVDVQGFLRCAYPDGQMITEDWPNKQKLLPLIRFLKADAAEAEVLTGYADRREAAKKLFSLGAREIMITHNTEALIYDGGTFYTQPLKPRNLSGRTGRGDTCFAAYITERLNHSIEEALLTASALVSLKMETRGPFLGSRADVEAYIKEFYQA
ncbi:MAG: PfkB family carbohydrate kinase [Christensenellaceae bacterium]|jgi:sugar/nucleoside kinase (ribokinase family)|nr:PfkB family carbohydrate kinase [Christensenellaceae bacterium]